MPGTCELCGGDVTQQLANGNYLGACSDCRANFEHPGRHINQCENADCIVCQDWREEFGRDPEQDTLF